MGTRAIIRLNGKFFLSTHWTGDPECLGKRLNMVRLKDEIIAIADKYCIDSITQEVINNIDEIKARIEKDYTENREKWKKLFGFKDDEIPPLSNASSFFPIEKATDFGEEFDYNLKDDKWYGRAVHIEWLKGYHQIADKKYATKYMPIPLLVKFKEKEEKEWEEQEKERKLKGMIK